MARNGRKMEFSFCELANSGKNLFTFCAITFEPIEVQTRSAPQNDRLNLCFVKDIYVDGKKLARNGRKTADSLLKDAVLTVQVRFQLSITSSPFCLCV
jgi:hypothetical protein